MNLAVSEYQIKGRNIEALVSFCDDDDQPMFSERVILNRKDSRQRYATKLKNKFPDQMADKDLEERLTELGKTIKDQLTNHGGNGSSPDEGYTSHTPDLPKDAWQGLFADYRNLVADTTEACDAFHYAVFLQVLGCTIGRRLHVYHAGKLYPNFYIALVGRSGVARKGAATNRGTDLLNNLHHQDDVDGVKPEFRVVTGIRSIEGLFEELNGTNKVRLIKVEELLSILSKAKQDASSNIVPQLTEIYDCPERHNPPVKSSNTQAIRPFVSILANTTQSWLTASLTISHIYGGFANRWMYFTGKSKEPNPSPPKVDAGGKQWMVSSINDVRKWASEVPDGEIKISPEATELFKKYYTGFYKRCQVDGLLPTMIVRVQDFVMKIAMLYASIEFSTTISAKHLENAIVIGDYLEASAINVFRTFAMSKAKQEEEKIIEYLQSIETAISKRDLYRALSLSAKELDSIMDHLCKIGMVRITVEKNPTNNKKTTLYQVIK